MKEINGDKYMFDVNDVKQNKIWAAIGYLGLFCFLPLFLRPKSKFAQWHARQGAVLFFAEVVVFFVNVVPFIGDVLWLIAVWCFAVLSIVGIVKALRGESWEIPLIGHYAEKIKL